MRSSLSTVIVATIQIDLRLLPFFWLAEKSLMISFFVFLISHASEDSGPPRNRDRTPLWLSCHRAVHTRAASKREIDRNQISKGAVPVSQEFAKIEYGGAFDTVFLVESFQFTLSALTLSTAEFIDSCSREAKRSEGQSLLGTNSHKCKFLGYI
jgi:hypothetical protein